MINRINQRIQENLVEVVAMIEEKLKGLREIDQGLDQDKGTEIEEDQNQGLEIEIETEGEEIKNIEDDILVIY